MGGDIPGKCLSQKNYWLSEMIRKTRRLALFLVLGLIFVSSHWALGQTTQTAPSASIQASTADHSSFEVLQQKFESGRELTKACLGCHNLAAVETNTLVALVADPRHGPGGWRADLALRGHARRTLPRGTVGRLRRQTRRRAVRSANRRRGDPVGMEARCRSGLRRYGHCRRAALFVNRQRQLALLRDP